MNVILPYFFYVKEHTILRTAALWTIQSNCGKNLSRLWSVSKSDDNLVPLSFLAFGVSSFFFSL